jgi:hypothetical protein
MIFLWFLTLYNLIVDNYLGCIGEKKVDIKEEKSRKQRLGILEKMSMLSDGKKAQVKGYVEQAIIEEQQQPAEVDKTKSEHGN